jgi:hypothetical protein
MPNRVGQIMNVTAKKLAAVALGLMVGVGAVLLWQTRSTDRAPARPVAVAPAVSPQIEPVITLPPFSVAVGAEGTRVNATKLRMSDAMSEDDAMAGISSPSEAAKGLGLREGRGRFGRLRPADVRGQIHSATTGRVSEPPAPLLMPHEEPVPEPGVLEPNDVERTIKQHRGEVRACARLPNGTRAGRLARGKIAVRWTVGSDGAAQDVEVAESTIDDVRVSQCVMETVSRWRFAPPEGGPALAASTFVFQ